MRSPRLALAVTALVAVTALAGCSGDDDSSDQNSDTSADAAASDGSDPKVIQRKCDVTVEMAGAVEASWSGKGSSSNEAGPTLYTFTKSDDRISVYAGTDDIPTNATLTVGGETFTTADPGEGLEVDADGKSAEVDAETTGIDGPGPQVTATFTCGKGGKG